MYYHENELVIEKCYETSGDFVNLYEFISLIYTNFLVYINKKRLLYSYSSDVTV